MEIEKIEKFCGWCKRVYWVIPIQIEILNCPYCDAQEYPEDWEDEDD